jgi:uncharacterized phage-associated protein
MKTLEIAKDIVFLCNKNNYEFNNTKIQKLLYLFVGFCLINGIEEIYDIDEKPKLWPYGPVFPKVHKKFEGIKEIKRDKIESISNKEAINILEKTVEKWGIIPAGKLSSWSHSEDSPWYLMVKEGAKWNTEIDLSYIKIYFARRVENIL